MGMNARQRTRRRAAYLASRTSEVIAAEAAEEAEGVRRYLAYRASRTEEQLKRENEQIAAWKKQEAAAQEERAFCEEQDRRVLANRRPVQSELRRLGFVREHTSDTSNYYRRGDDAIRVSDHKVPWTPERSENSNSWADREFIDLREYGTPIEAVDAVRRFIRDLEDESVLGQGNWE